MKHSGIFKLFLVMAMAGVVLHLAMATTWAGGTIYCYQRVLKSVPAHYLDVQYEWTACAAGSFAPNSCIKCVLYKSEADKSGRVVLDTQEGAFKKTWGTGTKGIAENCIELTLNTLAYVVSTDGCADPNKWSTTMPK